MEYINLSIGELKNIIDMDNLPKHIGIIMDGNGRWAKKRSLPRNFGHREGMERVIDVVEASLNLGIESLSLFAFSTENWKRPEKEISGLMKILLYFLRRELEKLHKKNIQIKVMGDISAFPDLQKNEIIKAVEKTSNNKKMILNIGLNYGGRDEIVGGIKNLLKDLEMGKMEIEDLNTENFSDYLYTKGQAELDLLIRPSGELRISNFMLYQLAYAEFYFSNILWPDFKEKELLLSIIDYQKRNRRFGGI